ncbi:MAG: hypothetical protein A2268_13495 [Candidatus Raymondbacteria bacterium RifOxyA12_full_50_37]|nr:MAG: hypothetical protein A2268_13495 [Candidatus Raymondbacteria bacterium RifOxyA12_full_50_37]OGJ91517.1 MAG: hypothetical protein A2248_03700 [Candidatus Raymondbacteria bacterium RIFOXYA2_FULL_49_16]OGJ93067.1 MAG: hypothetical protein A2350_04800 [Candidatus Raymondbacteria bacterium RifOxyB12_full_50_8]OGJ97831.1 MAG: hypothetical protein A2453_14085 [Candidatus Raymondbacteria bacterium RIFOXYC2_FULL_50_21]OGK02118.1 MAG: hypothetical protein A2487_20945 [Candidatus Raymondbacteria b
MKSAFTVLAIACAAWAISVADYLKCTIPAIQDPAGRAIITVEKNNSESLAKAIKNAKPNTTILIPDGAYKINDGCKTGKCGYQFNADNITLRGQSGDPEKVVISGMFGFKNKVAADEEMFIIAANKVTIADITLRDSRCHGIKLLPPLSGTLIHNVHFYDIGERSIKGVRNQKTNKFNENGVVEYCYFEQITPLDTDRVDADTLRDQDYIAGIDCMMLKNWRFHHNVFKNIRGATGGGRAGIFLWHGSRDIVAEDNLFLHCDRGIAFGNPSGKKDCMTNGVIRNNYIIAGIGRPIELCFGINITVAKNTIYNTFPDSAQPTEQTVFLQDIKKAKIRDNIIMGNIFVFSGDKPDTSGNIFNAKKEWFKDPAMGNLDLVKPLK